MQEKKCLILLKRQLIIFWKNWTLKLIYQKTAKDIKEPVAIAELRRAHYIIVILFASLAGIIAVDMKYKLQFDLPLEFIAIILLVLVIFITLGTVAFYPNASFVVEILIDVARH